LAGKPRKITLKFLLLIKWLVTSSIIASILLFSLYFVVDNIIERSEHYNIGKKMAAIQHYLDTEKAYFLSITEKLADSKAVQNLLLRNSNKNRRNLLKRNRFESDDIGFVALFNRSKKIKFSRSYEPSRKAFTKLDEKIKYQLAKKNLLELIREEKKSIGIIEAEDVTLVAIVPVYTGKADDFSGYLVLGKTLDTGKLKAVTSSNVNIQPVNLALQPAQDRELKAFEKKPIIHQRNKFESKTSLLITGITGKPVSILSISREHEDIKSMLQVSWLSLLVLMTVSLVVAYLFWRNKRNILNKDIKRLVADIENVKIGTELSGRISNENRHIFTAVVNAINQKIGGFEKSIDTIHTVGRRHDAEIVLNELPMEAYLKDTDLKYITVNQKYCDRHGISREDVLGKTDAELDEAENITDTREKEEQAISTKEPVTFEEIIETNLRGKIFYSTHLIPFINDKGRVEGVVGVKINITNLRRAESEMEMASKVLENTAEGVMVTDAESRIIHVNSAYSELTGYNEEELLGKVPLLLQKESRSKIYQGVQKSLETDGLWRGELWSSRKNGTSYPEMINIKAIRNKEGKISNYFSMSNDITEQKKWEEQLYQMAHYDSLTGLPNRTLFKDRLKQEIIRSERNDKNFGLLFLDLDLFKSINDSLGHAAGDELLIVVGDRLKDTLRNADSIARLGGDEFTIMVTDLASDYDKNINYLTRLSEKIIEVIKQPIEIGGREINATCSVGVTVFPVDADNVEDLLRNADSAMYYAKSQGRRNYQFYSKEFNEQAVERLEKEIEFRAALKDGALQLYYQPQIDVISRHVVGAEALLRWKKDGEVIMGPDKIVALAEETGLIFELGNWILRQACEQCKKWTDQGHSRVRVAVNLSTRQFRQKDLVEIVSNILDETGLPGRLLELEVTESALMENIEYSVEMMADLSRKGIRWSLDDFGTGYSSLTYLRDFPVHVLKVDQSFVKEITINPEDSAIVETIIDLAHRLHLTVIAEGVENEEQLKVLSRMNCEQVQGYYFGEPMSANEFVAYIGKGVRV